MLLILLKGWPGCGKTTLARALSKKLHWPLIDKDDIRDLLDEVALGTMGLSYDIMLNIVRRQLLQGLSVICDSPLSFEQTYQNAQKIAHESGARIVVIEVQCSNQSMWRARIEARKTQALPANRQIDWEHFQLFIAEHQQRQQYLNSLITHPRLILDTAQPLEQCLTSSMDWLTPYLENGDTCN